MKKPISRERHRRDRTAARWPWAVMLLVMMVFLSGVVMDRAVAAITLKTFKATRLADGSIKVEWETASEIDTVAFRLYRSQSATTAGQIVATQQALGNSVTGASYNYTDPASELVAGRNYYYRLEELTASGDTSWYGPVNPGGTSASTTRSAIGMPTATDPPTATRRYTNTPVPPTPLPPTQVIPVQPTISLPTAVPPGLGVVTTPTGLPALAAVPLPPTVTPAIPMPSPTPPPTETFTPTPSNTPRPTVTPTLTAAPVVFVARAGDEVSTATAALVATPEALAPSPERAEGGNLPVGVMAGAALAVGAVLGFLALSMRRTRRS